MTMGMEDSNRLQLLLLSLPLLGVLVFLHLLTVGKDTNLDNCTIQDNAILREYLKDDFDGDESFFRSKNITMPLTAPKSELNIGVLTNVY